jgi:lysophospholipase L1-like esterase
VTRFLAFGDSLTAGVTSTSLVFGVLTSGLPHSYPYKLQTMLAERYTEQTPIVLDGGQGGERASEAHDRLNALLDEADPDVLLLMDGANDLLALGEAGIGATVGAIETLVKDARGRGVRVLLATLPPQREGGRRADAAPFLADFNAELKKMAAEEGVDIVDLFAHFDVALQGVDGLHPTEAGYQRIAEIFRDRIRDLFEMTQTTARDR